MNYVEPLEETYFNWLCAKVVDPKVPNYTELMRILYKTEFVWIVLGDDNRMMDGLELREDFLREAYVRNDPEWFGEPCSVLEVFIAFAKTAQFETDVATKDWFWEFMQNLDLSEYRQISEADVPVIEEILNTFIWRTYNDAGHGGMFPLRWPKKDQREVEIWYQFCEYIDENDRL